MATDRNMDVCAPSDGLFINSHLKGVMDAFVINVALNGEFLMCFVPRTMPGLAALIVTLVPVNCMHI